MDEKPARDRILEAAFAAFTDGGYAATSTAEIAARARVSKRELYALVGDKQELLIACITDRANRLRLPGGLPEVHDRSALRRFLVSFGVQLLREITDPAVIAAFRLAIGEASRVPEIAKALDLTGRQNTRLALEAIMAQAKRFGLVEGRPRELAQLFGALLFRDLLMSLLLGVVHQPSAREIEKRAEEATALLLLLHQKTGAVACADP